MKIIDLLNKIANGEEVPKKIKYLSYEYEFNKEDKEYQRDYKGYNYGLGEDRRLDIILDDQVEIIEEQQPTEEEINMYTNKFLEVWEPISKQFGKLFDEIIRIKNDLGLNLEDFIKEEPQEHKIPEKIEMVGCNMKVNILDKETLLPTENMQTEFLIKKINEILDYLEVNNGIMDSKSR